MNTSFLKKIKKPSTEIHSRSVWIRIYAVFTILHFIVLISLSYFFRELVRGIDAPVEGNPQTNIATLEVLESKLSAVEARMSKKTHSLLAEVKNEDPKEVLLEPSILPSDSR